MNYIIEGEGALVNEAGRETPLKFGDFALVMPDEKHQYRNKGDKPFKMICGVPKVFEQSKSSDHFIPGTDNRSWVLNR
jgi:quercetin dioxygenase-like cupin family protein